MLGSGLTDPEYVEMIQINLLPPEKRRVEKTPPHIFVLMIVDVILITSLIFYLISIYLKVSETERIIKDHKVTLKELKPFVTAYDKAESELSGLTKMIKEIEGVVIRRFKISDALDAITEVIQQNPKIWIEKVELLDPRRIKVELRKRVPGLKGLPEFAVALSCNAAGLDAQVITRFRMDLKTDPRIKQMLPNLAHAIDYTYESDEDYVEGGWMGFNLILYSEPKQAPKPSPKRR